MLLLSRTQRVSIFTIFFSFHLFDEFFTLFFMICILIWFFFFVQEDEDAILESATDLNLPKEKDENKAGGNSDQALPSLNKNLDNLAMKGNTYRLSYNVWETRPSFTSPH